MVVGLPSGRSYKPIYKFIKKKLLLFYFFSKTFFKPATLATLPSISILLSTLFLFIYKLMVELKGKMGILNYIFNIGVCASFGSFNFLLCKY